MSRFTRWKGHATPSDYIEIQFAQLRHEKSKAYRERNMIVALLAQMALAMGWRVGRTEVAIDDWDESWHGRVCIDLPTGQVSWHYNEAEALMFDALPKYRSRWDSHSRAEKYERINVMRIALEIDQRDEETAFNADDHFPNSRRRIR